MVHATLGVRAPPPNRRRGFPRSHGPNRRTVDDTKVNPWVNVSTRVTRVELGQGAGIRPDRTIAQRNDRGSSPAMTTWGSLQCPSRTSRMCGGRQPESTASRCGDDKFRLPHAGSAHSTVCGARQPHRRGLDPGIPWAIPGFQTGHGAYPRTARDDQEAGVRTSGGSWPFSAGG
jgi:hypothetical protein